LPIYGKKKREENKMKLTAFGGAGEIGGNKILLEAGKTRIFLDFGIPFNRGAGIYSGFDYLDPRDKLGLRDYFEFNMVPEIRGIYSPEALQYTKLKYSAPEFDALLISHIHSDHFGDVEDVDPKIPVYLGHGAKKLNDAFNTIYYMFKNEDNGNVVEFKSGKPFKIKDMEIIPVHVDHSIPGAYGFIIKTEEGNVAYTGDYRFHGFKPEMTDEFIKIANKTGIDYLITEGTRMKHSSDTDFRKKINEAGVEDLFCETIKKSGGITFVQFSFRNIDRVRSLINAAKKTGKILVCNPGFAYAVDNAGQLVSGMPSMIDNPDIRILCKDSDIPEDEKKHLKYAEPYQKCTVDYKWIKKNLKDVVMFMSPSEMSQMIDIQPGKGTFIYSMSEHYIEGEGNEEYKECLMNWLNHFGINLAQIHCSGHADAAGIKKMVDGVNAGAVIPVHTDCPEGFKKLAKKVVLLEKEKAKIL
jgi:ribonuclease J